ncbi:MAG: hypothetical protein HFJ00_06765 [Lachnospiraceae bacterium]|jgi:hypothetical protein|nr:hypothetical protein [Lachnospiraceae bacterium]
MGINLETIKLKEGIAKLINDSKLPPVNILLVLDSLTVQVNNFLEKSIKCEISAESQVKENGNPNN